MRTNIYQAELTQEAEIVHRKTNVGVLHGLRLFLKSPAALQFADPGDDRSAVTFWFRDLADADELLIAMRNAVDAAQAQALEPVTLPAPCGICGNTDPYQRACGRVDCERIPF